MSISRNVAFVVVALALAGAAASPVSAQTLTANGASSTTVKSGQDFAATVVGDPWDFSEATDYTSMFSDGWVRSSMVVANGRFTGTVSGTDAAFPTLQLQFEGINGALNLVGRNGVVFPIDAALYKRISFRMRRTPETGSALDTLQVDWYKNTTRATGTGGKLALTRGFDSQNNRYPNQSPVAVQSNAQYHIYKLDLDTAGGSFTFNDPYSGTVRGMKLRVGEGSLNPGGLGTATVEVDWVRLTPRGAATTALAWSGFAGAVTLTATNGTDTIQIFPDDGTSASTFPAAASFTWDHGFLPPGAWVVAARSGSQVVSATVNVSAAPIILLTNPDATGGRDFATTVIGDPWDMANVEDVTRHGRLANVTNYSFGSTGLTATSTSDDPEVSVMYDPNKPPGTELQVDANTYKHLTFTVEYDRKELTSTEALGDAFGGVMRIIWHRAGTTPNHEGVLTNSQDIFVLDGGPHTYSMDLSTFDKRGGDECFDCELESIQGPDLWVGQIGELRIDPYESSVPRTFRIANVKLTADDEPASNGIFTITWSAANAAFAAAAATAEGAPAVAEATVSLYYDTNTDPAVKTLIASGVAASAGQYAWNLGGIPVGRYWIYAEITDTAGNTQSRYSSGPLRIVTAFPATTDNDTDGMPDAWETKYGVTSPTADEDGDGVNNLAEFNGGTNPRTPNTWNLPEGATGFFLERIAVANPDTDQADISVTFLRESGAPIVRPYTIAGQSRLTITVNEIAGLSSTAVSAVINTTRGGVVVERTMMWNAQSGSFYGGHTGKAVQTARTQWYLAEGEANFFQTYILLANATASNAIVDVAFLLDNGQVIPATYTVAANSRVTVFANSIPSVAGRAFSTTITSRNAVPITVERAMYFGLFQGTGLFNGGHAAAAVEAPSTSWFVAEGRTGPFFDEYLLLANPGTAATNVTVRYLKPGGAVVVQTYTLNPTSRFTVHVDSVPGLADTDVSASITSDLPIIVERAMYWPDPFVNWYEAHESAGVTSTGTQWALAEGEVGGTLAFESYILVANPGATAATVTMTFLRTSGTPITAVMSVPANSRLTRSAAEFGLLSGEKFGVLIDSTQPIVVERAMYWNGGGQFWGGGTNETAVKLR